MALNSQGSKIYHSAELSPSAWQALEEVTSIGGPDGSAALIDVSHLGSTRKEYLPGLADSGQIALECNYTAGTEQQDMLRMFNETADAEAFRIQIPTTSAKTLFYTFDFLAIVMKWGLADAVDAKVKLTVTLQTTGGVTYIGSQATSG